MSLSSLGIKALHLFEPERAHQLALAALRLGVAPVPAPVRHASLHTQVAGIKLENPIGIAAGFDKNAVALAPMSRAGLGFIEVGAATPRPQVGNPKPRLFRLSEDAAVINRFGFNNEGMEPIANRLAHHTRTIPVGLNLGANKDSPDRTSDYAHVLAHCGAHIDFATVNVSSPNTEKLRDLQGTAALTAVLRKTLDTRDTLDRHIPIFLKIAPDLTEQEIQEIAGVALETGVDGIIATNTTLDRHGLTSAQRNQAGGLSGAPLFEKSTRVLAQLSQATNGQMPLIGVGGIGSTAQAYAKIRAGASALQLYSALVYHGLPLIHDILTGLVDLLEKDGFATISDAVGTDRGAWL